MQEIILLYKLPDENWLAFQPSTLRLHYARGVICVWTGTVFTPVDPASEELGEAEIAGGCRISVENEDVQDLSQESLADLVPRPHGAYVPRW